MKRSILGAFLVVAIAVSVAMTMTANATIVNFDDLVGQALVPNGYGGITWNGEWTYYGFDQSPYTPKSPPVRVYTFNAAAPFDFAAPALFQGAWFSGIADATVQFQLYSGTTLVASSAVLSPSVTPVFLSSGYSGLVTEVKVISPRPDYYVMDDVTYGGTQVPEPATLILLGSSLVGLIGLRRKLKK